MALEIIIMSPTCYKVRKPGLVVGTIFRTKGEWKFAGDKDIPLDTKEIIQLGKFMETLV